MRKGDRRNAVLFSTGANDAHGLRRTNEDKRQAVQTLLDDPEWSRWSDREIAKRCAVDHKTVAAIRSAYLGNSPDSSTPPQVKKVQRGDATYTQDTSGVSESNKSRAKPADDQTPESPAPQESRQEAADDPAQPPFVAAIRTPEVAAKQREREAKRHAKVESLSTESDAADASGVESLSTPTVQSSIPEAPESGGIASSATPLERHD